jgi:hypothetical protein
MRRFLHVGDRMADMILEAVRHQQAKEEAEIRRLLGFWTSETKPCVYYDQDRNLIGLGFPVEIGERPVIALKAWHAESGNGEDRV